jgi:hypothetical protein
MKDVRAMLEFYSVLSRRTPHRMPRFNTSRRTVGALLVASSAAWLAACATPGAPVAPTTPTAPIPANREPPPPNVNLSGFPLPYRQGYADGCASAGGAERKDAARFSSDPNYRTGWQDGVVLCRKR